MKKMHPSNYDYGECEMCDTPLVERLVTQDFWIRGELIVIEHVLAGVCPQCGEKVVNAEIGKHLLELLHDTKSLASAPHISVPVLKYDDYIEHAVQGTVPA